jgi:hypothetical protein
VEWGESEREERGRDEGVTVVVGVGDEGVGEEGGDLQASDNEYPRGKSS